MVDVLMLASLGDTNLGEILALSEEYDVVRKERTQSFFSNRTIYDATAFTQTNASGRETAYLGVVDIAPNGRLGFDPSVVLSGDVAGASFHDFLASEVGAHHDAATIWSNLLKGDDVVIGNGRGADLYGFDGDDVLLPNSPYPGPGAYTAVSGGGGDDLIFSGGESFGGTGADRFVADDRSIGLIRDFEHGLDKVLLDRTVFADVGNRITRENFHLGPTAGDADDRIIVRQVNPDYNYFEISIDPDGVGGADQGYVGSITSDHKLTFRDFGMVDAATLMPDISGLFDKGATPLADPPLEHPFAIDHVALARDLTHHGLIQLV